MADDARRKVLVLLAHPVLERSRVNRRLAEAIADLPGITMHDLYEEYPTLSIDVAREQELLREHDTVIFQHPFYWYSTPAICKEWQDLVLEHGWAYGAGATALHGKTTFNALTTGGPERAYCQDGYNHFTVRQLLAPYEQTARLCGMRYLAPFVVYGTLGLEGDDDVRPHMLRYRAAIERLLSGTLDLERAATACTLNEVLE